MERFDDEEIMMKLMLLIRYNFAEAEKLRDASPFGIGGADSMSAPTRETTKRIVEVMKNRKLRRSGIYLH